MLSCRDITELATDHVEGATPLATRMSMWMHLAMCKHCREYLRQYRETIVVLGRLPDEPPPAECVEELLRRFRRPDP